MRPIVCVFLILIFAACGTSTSGLESIDRSKTGALASPESRHLANLFATLPVGRELQPMDSGKAYISPSYSRIQRGRIDGFYVFGANWVRRFHISFDAWESSNYGFKRSELFVRLPMDGHATFSIALAQAKEEENWGVPIITEKAVSSSRDMYLGEDSLNKDATDWLEGAILDSIKGYGAFARSVVSDLEGSISDLRARYGYGTGINQTISRKVDNLFLDLDNEFSELQTVCERSVVKSILDSCRTQFSILEEQLAKADRLSR